MPVDPALSCQLIRPCHASEGWHPVFLKLCWMPACAGMTRSAFSGMTVIVFTLTNVEYHKVAPEIATRKIE